LSDRKLFCEYGPFCYKLSLFKQHTVKRIKNLLFSLKGNKFARKVSPQNLPVLVKDHFSIVVRNLPGVDLSLQYNKAKNLEIAAATIDGIVINPGETFSFWKRVGSTTEKKGYLEGMTIKGSCIGRASGGGLCQLANLIHWLVLNSPLKVSELHHHTDALFPDDRRRVPFGTGTSVFYNHLDYRFTNTTDIPVQIRVWVKDNILYGELRSTKEFPYEYSIIEEGHCFVKEAEDYFRCSRIYKEIKNKENGKVAKRELVLENHSKVMYDHSLIPAEEISDVRL